MPAETSAAIACVLMQDSAFFKDFDIDGNGRISYDEYLLFTTLISIPREDLQGLGSVLTVKTETY